MSDLTEVEYPKGTLWLTPDGTTYRLRSWGVDWSKSTEGEIVRGPAFDRASLTGYSMVYALPADAVLIWAMPALSDDRESKRCATCGHTGIDHLGVRGKPLRECVPIRGSACDKDCQQFVVSA